MGFGQGLPQGDGLYVWGIQGDHGSEVAPLHQLDGGRPEAQREETIVGDGLPAALASVPDWVRGHLGG